MATLISLTAGKVQTEDQTGDAPAPGGLSESEALASAAIFKALGDPVRIRLYSRIAAAAPNAVCVCDIDDVGVSQPTVSHHLRKLREVGLIDCERRGSWVHYWAVPGATSPIRELL